MKTHKYYILILFTCLLAFSCSVEDQLDDSIQLSFQAKAMNIADPLPVIALDTGYFSVLVSHPFGLVQGFSVQHLSDFQGFIDKSIVVVSNDITVSANGTFSEPVKTAVINYPVKASSTPGDILEAQFTFTDTEGKTTSTVSRMIVVNFKTYGTLEWLFLTRPLHSFHTGLSYAAVNAAHATLKDSLDVFWFRENLIHHIASPDADRTAQEFATRYGTVNYQQSAMNRSRFIKLPDGTALADVGDDTFANMDFSNAVDVIVGEHLAVYGVLLHDNRKAALEFNISGANSRVRSKVQVAPAK
jgi:hypothetical protein